MRRIAVAATAVLAVSGAASAQGRLSVGECDWLANMLNVVEPWEANSRTFYNGQVRVVFADAVEPACCWAHLVLLVPNPSDELGLRQCLVVNQGGGLGFSGLDFSRLEASYDPAVGLTIIFPYAVYDFDTGASGPWRTGRVTINLVTGAVLAQ